MGEEVDFSDLEGAADPKVVEKLAHLEVDDPQLLARLIDGHAGFDLDAGLVNFEAKRRKLRAELLKQMKQLQQLALTIAGKVGNQDWISPAELVVADLLHGPDWPDLEQAQHYLTLLERIGTIRLPENLSEFGGKPELDGPTTRVVSAVAHYCARMRIEFTGEPRAEQIIGAVTYPIKGPAAILTRDVVKALGIEVKPWTLATHMKKARAFVEVLTEGRAK